MFKNKGPIGTMNGWGWERGWSQRAQRYFWYNRSKNISVWELEDILKLNKPHLETANCPNLIPLSNPVSIKTKNN